MRINSKKSKTFMIMLLFLTATLFVFEKTTNCQSVTTRDVKTYALLVDQFAPNSNNPGEYFCNAVELRNNLLAIGWQESSFDYLFGDDEITTANVKSKMDFLEEKADANDVVLVYFCAHGWGCLRDMLDFNSWFHNEFLEIPTDYKYLLIDSCHAGEFILPFAAYENSDSFYAMGSVAPIELGVYIVPEMSEWPYSEPEFSGTVSSHFWSITLTNSSADVNLDTFVDMGELYDFSLPIIKKIFSELFIQRPDLAELIENTTGYLDDYPRPVVINSLSEDISLYTDYLVANIETLPLLTTQQKYGLIFGSIGATVAIGVVVIFLVVRKRRKSPVEA